MTAESTKRLGVGDVNHVIGRLQDGASIAYGRSSGTHHMDGRLMTQGLWDRVENLVRLDKATGKYVIKTQEWREEQARLRVECEPTLDDIPTAASLRHDLRERIGSQESELARVTAQRDALLAACREARDIAAGIDGFSFAVNKILMVLDVALCEESPK